METGRRIGISELGQDGLWNAFAKPTTYVQLHQCAMTTAPFRCMTALTDGLGSVVAAVAVVVAAAAAAAAQAETGKAAILALTIGPLCRRPHSPMSSSARRFHSVCCWDGGRVPDRRGRPYTTPQTGQATSLQPTATSHQALMHRTQPCPSSHTPWM